MTISALAVDLSKVLVTSEEDTDLAQLLSEGWSFLVDERKVDVLMGPNKVSALFASLACDAGTEAAPRAFAIEGWHPSMRDTVVLAGMKAKPTGLSEQAEAGMQVKVVTSTVAGHDVISVVRDNYCRVCTQPSSAHRVYTTL